VKFLKIHLFFSTPTHSHPYQGYNLAMSLESDAEGNGMKETEDSQVLVAYACNPSDSGGRDQKDHCSKPALQIVCKTLS
jgi:hypothetical protein